MFFKRNKIKNKVKTTKKIKSTIVGVVLFSLTLQMIPAPQRAMAFDFGGFLDKIFQKVQIPNEFELTERGGLKLGTETRNYLGMFDCMFKKRETAVVNSKGKIELKTEIGFCGCDSSFHCGYKNDYGFGFKASCASEWKEGDVCISPFSTFKLGEWQTDLTEQTEFGRALAVPQPKAPRECQLKIPLPEDDFSMSVEEKSAHQAACNYFIALEQAAAQEVFAVKKMYNNTDPLSNCFFLRNCKSNCSLRFGEVRYDITVLDILKFLIPGGALTYIQQIMTVVSTIQKAVKIASALKDFLVDGADVLNNAYGIIQNFSAVAAAWQNMGLKWKDALSVITGPIGYALNRERLAKGYDGFLGLIQNFSNNMIEYSAAKAQALQVADQSVKDLTAIISEGKPDPVNPSQGIAGFKNEPEIGFLFATDKAGKNGKDNYDKRVMFDGIIKDYQNAFISIRGLLNNISAIGDVVGSQSITERRNVQDGCEDWFNTFCTCQPDDKCGKLVKNKIWTDVDTYWKTHKNMTFLDFVKTELPNTNDFSKEEVINCETCWNNYASCENKYCSEGVIPDEVKWVAFDLKHPNYDSAHTVGLTCPTCEYADNIKQEAKETAKKIGPEYQQSNWNACGTANYACLIDQGDRYKPMHVEFSSPDDPGTKVSTTWLILMKDSFSKVQQLGNLFNAFDVDYVQGKINRALSFIPEYVDEDKGIKIKDGIYTYNQLDYSKAPWRVFWEDLAMAISGLSATEFYDKTNEDSKFFWGQDGKADKEQRHKNLMLYVAFIIPALKPIAYFDETYTELNYKFNEGNYQDNKVVCDRKVCPLSYSINPSDGSWNIQKNGALWGCDFILPQHVKQCLLDIREALQERTVFSAGFISNWEKGVTTTAASLNLALGDLQTKYPVQNKTALERFWQSANWCASGVSSCSAGWENAYQGSYKAELAELPDWDGRIETFIRNALPVDGPTSNIENIAEAITDFNLSPENSILVYYIVKAKDYFKDLADTNNTNGFEARIDKIMDGLNCSAGGGGGSLLNDCKNACKDLTFFCKTYCNNHECIQRECTKACRPFSSGGSSKWGETVDQFALDNGLLPPDPILVKQEADNRCYDYCGDNCGVLVDDPCTRCPDTCLNACEQGERICHVEYCDKLPVNNVVCQKLQELKQKLNDFFASEDYKSFDDYLKQAKNLLRNIQREWEKPLPAGNEAVIARGYIAKILQLIFDSQKLVANTDLQRVVCDKDNYNYPVLMNYEAPIPKIADLISVLNGIIGKIAVLTGDSALSAVKPDLDSIILDLRKPVDLVQTNILDEIKDKVGTVYECPPDHNNVEYKDFLHKIACFEQDKSERSLCQVLSFLDVMDILFQSQEKITETKQAIEVLKPQIKMEFSQEGITDKKALEMMKNDPLGKFPFWENDGNGIKIAGVPIKGFADFKKAVDLNPIVFLQGAYKAIKGNISIMDTILKNAYDAVNLDDVFGKSNQDKPRKEQYQKAITNFRTQNLLDLERRVFGDPNLTTACKLISLILQSDPRDTRALCETRTDAEMEVLNNKGLEATCRALLNADLSILDRQLDDIQTEIDRLNKQREAAGTYDLKCPDNMVQAVKNGACYKGGDKNNQGVAPCWPPTKSPLDKSGYTQGYQAVAEFCKTTEEQLRDLGGAGLSNICSIVGLPTDETTCNNETEANLEVIQKAVDEQLEQCNEMEAQKAFEKECQYIEMLIKHVFNDSCNLSSCSAEENEDFANGADPTRCKERCKEARDTIKPALCFQLTGKTNCSIPDLSLKGISADLDPDCTQIDVKGEGELNDDEKELCLLLEARDKALNACSFGADNIKQPLDEVMKIFSILIGIRSATKLYNGVQSFVGDVKKMSDSFGKLIKAIKGDGGEGEKKTKGILTQLQDAWEGMNEESGSGGLTITPLQCNSHPAESYSDLTKQKVSGPQGGPVCPDVSDFFGQVEAQFGLIRNNVKQIDLSRKDIEQRYLPLPFKLNIHLFDKKEVVFPSINELHDTASAIKQKAQFVWALAFAVNFAAKNCTCGESYCKMPFCISGLPLAFGPISNASCYLTWVLRYPMLKIAESLENDLEAIE